MKYSIDERTEDNSKHIILKNNNTGEYCKIAPEAGARIVELMLSNDRDMFSILKTPDLNNTTARDEIFANAKLSPFAGRIENGKYNFNGHEYQLPVNYQEENNACHGFLYLSAFEILELTQTNENAVCKLKYVYDKIFAGYPFKYSIEISYILSDENGLSIVTNNKNLSEEDIPITDGWHPYFMFTECVDNIKIKTPGLIELPLNENKIPNGDQKVFNDFIAPKEIGTRKFDTCFKINGENSEALISVTDKINDLQINIKQECGNGKYKYILIYTPPDRKSIAIEPMTSNVNAFNNHEDLIILAPGKVFNASISISVDKLN